MTMYMCEKLECVEGDDTFIRLIVYEIDENDSKSVLDITHHDTDKIANIFLQEHWNINNPPNIGQPLSFKRDDPNGEKHNEAG